MGTAAIVTREHAEALVAEHGTHAKAAAAAGCAKSTIWKALHRGEPKTRQCVDDGATAMRVAPATGGFDLHGRHLVAKKPTDIWGPRFNALRPETGYLPDTLCKQWGCSLATVRDRARAAGAIRYTEQNEEWVEVIVNPKTRGGK